MVDPNIVVSNIIGGVIALGISVGISRWEFNRQDRAQRDNWYRAVHNICVRAYSSRGTDHRTIDNAKMSEYAQLYRAFSDQLESKLAEAPTDDVDLPLFNSLQNIQLACIRYANEVATSTPNKRFLNRRHDTIIDFTQIALYLIEHKKGPGLELLNELDGEELEGAKETYEKFSEGTLFKNEDEEVRGFLEEIEKLDE